MLGKPSSPIFDRVHQSKNELENSLKFKLQIKRQAVKSFEDYLFKNKIKTFETEKLTNLLVSSYLLEDFLSNYFFDEEEKLFQLLQLVSFIRRYESTKESVL